MIMKAFCIYDTKSLAYGMPFFMQSAGAAVRAFGDLASDVQSTIYKHPKDFILYEIGSFDDSKATLVSTNPHSLGFASDYLVVAPPSPVCPPPVLTKPDKCASVAPMEVK